ncbi:MAG: hypothetical protein RI907_988 [Pseudomonadota bacterium]|jgi:hypothetical protein
MPGRFDYEAAKAIFSESELLKVRKDGVWLRKKRVPRLPRSEREIFAEHPYKLLWVPCEPSPESRPVLRIPFTAKELAACFFVGAGAQYASEHFGYSGGDLRVALEALVDAPAAKHAIRAAYAELRKASKIVGKFYVQHEEDAQRKARARDEALRSGRVKLRIDAKLAEVSTRLEAELSDRKCKLEEALAPLKKAVAAGDDTAIRQETALRDGAELQDAKSRESANLDRENIWRAFAEWKAQDPDYLRLCEEADKARKAADDAEKTWRTAMLRHLLSSEQAAPEKAAQTPTPLDGQTGDHGNDALNGATTRPISGSDLVMPSVEAPAVEKTPTVQEAIAPYVRLVMQDNPHYTADQLHRHMRRFAGDDGSPFSKLKSTEELFCFNAGRKCSKPSVAAALTAYRKSKRSLHPGAIEAP